LYSNKSREVIKGVCGRTSAQGDLLFPINNSFGVGLSAILGLRLLSYYEFKGQKLYSANLPIPISLYNLIPLVDLRLGVPSTNLRTSLMRYGRTSYPMIFI
jgi:hypothetical protein